MTKCKFDGQLSYYLFSIRRENFETVIIKPSDIFVTAMILSFALNVCQCVKKTNSTTNTDHENIVRPDDIETNSNTMPENSTPLLVPQLMQSTDFRNYFPERNKYESKFSNFSQTDENKGILLVEKIS